MIVFEYPLYLHLCWLAPVFISVWFIMLNKQATKNSAAGNGVLKKMVAGHVPFILYLKFTLMLASLVILVMALAKPKMVTETYIVVPANQTSVVFALDVSKSMLVADVPPNRLTLAKNTLVKIINGLHGEQAGIVIFAGNANTYIPLTTEYKVIIDAIQYISNNSVARQGTSLGEALKTSSFLLYPKNIRVKTIAVLSDGENLTDSFQAVADSARNAGIKLFAFGAGTQAGGYISQPGSDNAEVVEKDKSGKPIVSRLNEQNLRKICGTDTGRYHALGNPAGDAGVFLSELHKLQSGVKQKTMVEKDFFQLFLFTGLVLLITELLIPHNFKKS